MRQRTTRLRYARLKAAQVGAIVAALSVAALFAGAAMKPGVPTTTLINIAGVGLSLGIASVVYELYLRAAVTTETLELVGIRESIERVGLRQIVEAGSVDWRSFAAGSEEFFVLLVDPLGWVQREWAHILDTGRLRPVRVELYLPDPQWKLMDHLAARLGFEEDAFRSQLEASHRFLEEAWKAATTEEPRLKSGSSFNIRLYDMMPAYEIAVSSREAMIFIPAALQRKPSDKSLALRFEGQQDDFPSEWLASQLRRLDTVPPSFSNTVR